MGFAEVEGWAPPNACKLEVVGGGRVGEGGILGARGGVLKKKHGQREFNLSWVRRHCLLKIFSSKGTQLG